jgi:hypothetical protein
MQLVAQEIRAARDEQLLAAMEMPNLLRSYEDQIRAIDAALAAADSTVASCLQQQDSLSTAAHHTREETWQHLA